MNFLFFCFVAGRHLHFSIIYRAAIIHFSYRNRAEKTHFSNLYHYEYNKGGNSKKNFLLCYIHQQRCQGMYLIALRLPQSTAYHPKLRAILQSYMNLLYPLSLQSVLHSVRTAIQKDLRKKHSPAAVPAYH